MTATYRALCAHGYAGTSISRIAEEFPKSKSLLYYHYEDKDELLADFLGFLLDQLEAELEADTPDGPEERLDDFLDKLVPTGMDEEHLQFFQALIEMRAQAPHDETFRRQFDRTDDVIVATLTETIEAGIEQGVFRRVEATQTAEFIHAMVYGMLVRSVLVDDEAVLESTREELDNYVDRHLRIEA
ncbi:TetR family transcriptional regulator [Halorhabdus sp. CBA1104]|nr:TetR family transcriptional regulator [Halorhabdus sp. CBA1104]